MNTIKKELEEIRSNNGAVEDEQFILTKNHSLLENKI